MRMTSAFSDLWVTGCFQATLLDDGRQAAVGQNLPKYPATERPNYCVKRPAPELATATRNLHRRTDTGQRNFARAGIARILLIRIISNVPSVRRFPNDRRRPGYVAIA